MKAFRIITVVLVLLGMLMTPACGKKEKIQLPEITVPPTESAVQIEPEVVPEDTSLLSLRQSMVETPQLFAVAYFGYYNNWETGTPVDPCEVIGMETPQLCENLPFLMEISKDQIVGEHGDLYCIVPLDEDAAVMVSGGYWDEENQQYIYDDVRYSSESGEPILLLCNDAGWEPDTQVMISGPSGDVVWYPQLDDNRCVMPVYNDHREVLFRDFSSYREILAKDYRDMTGEWVVPTEDFLVDSTWQWAGFLKDGRDVFYEVRFFEDTLAVRWNDGLEEAFHEFPNAAWELTQEDGYGVLTIDFREFAGVVRYNLLYHEAYDVLYVAMDVLQEELPIGWEPLCRWLVRPSMPDPTEMAGTWELVWTELEGYREEAEPGTCTLEITTDYVDLYWISLTDYAFPDQSYADKELVVAYGEQLYYNCGNDAWMATVNTTGIYGTEYSLTLLPDDTLLLQRYWELDGAPMVGYAGYRRM